MSQHTLKVELLQADGRTLEISPAGGIRTSAPLLSRGDLLELGQGEYIVLAVRQSYARWQDLGEWTVVSTYLVDEARDAAEGVVLALPGGAGDEDRQFSELMSQVWADGAEEAA
ncbi:hypothetical protein [Streptomyces sp. NPDC017448]|uniref:hypothetical protein n=1 Tax=Streptomyces sp. NPDC017448 TaxID=3364996 RepID=UPI0037B80125